MWGGGEYLGIDLLIWGSPCQWFSMAWKMLNFDDPRSKLFFEYVRILKEVKPKYFLLENVKMKKEFQDVISSALWVQPIEINSALVSAQNRKRLYWTNIPWITQPQDKWILLKDILEANPSDKYNCSEKQIQIALSWKHQQDNIQTTDGKARTLVAWTHGNAAHYTKTLIDVVEWEVRIKQATKQWYIVAEEWDGISLSYPNSTTRRWRVTRWKANTLVCQWDSYVYEPKIAYAPWSREFEQQWWKTDKSPTICARDYKDPKVVAIPQMGRIRKLTPIECERLQTLPDNYTEWISDTQRYKMLGNWWTCDVVAHIFRFIPKEDVKT